jgi:arylsulfatase
MKAMDNTLILFLSDNGASAEMMVRDGGHDPKAVAGSADTHLCLGPGWSSAANTPFRLHKTWVHEGGISTPFIAHWPKGIQGQGEFRRTPGHVIDLTPTILELASGGRSLSLATNAPAMPGHSLVPMFKRDGKAIHDELWWSHESNKAIRAGDWKLVSRHDSKWELYDLKADRGEQHDLSSKRQGKVTELEERWQALDARFTRDAREGSQ